MSSILLFTCRFNANELRQAEKHRPVPRPTNTTLHNKGNTYAYSDQLYPRTGVDYSHYFGKKKKKLTGSYARVQVIRSNESDNKKNERRSPHIGTVGGNSYRSVGPPRKKPHTTTVYPILQELQPFPRVNPHEHFDMTLKGRTQFERHQTISHEVSPRSGLLAQETIPANSSLFSASSNGSAYALMKPGPCPHAHGSARSLMSPDSKVNPTETGESNSPESDPIYEEFEPISADMPTPILKRKPPPAQQKQVHESTSMAKRCDSLPIKTRPDTTSAPQWDVHSSKGHTRVAPMTQSPARVRAEVHTHAHETNANEQRDSLSPLGFPLHFYAMGERIPYADASGSSVSGGSSLQSLPHSAGYAHCGGTMFPLLGMEYDEQPQAPTASQESSLSSHLGTHV